MILCLIVRARSLACAIPLAHVGETMRRLPTEPLEGTPSFVRGLSVIRGRPLPVLDLGSLLAGGASGDATRYVTIRAGERLVALGVDEVVGVRRLEPDQMERLPGIISCAGSGLVDAIGSMGAGLLMVLDASRLLSEEIAQTLPPEAGTVS